MARLLISSPDGKRGILEITKPVITVGRGHSNDLVLNDSSVSRFHAVIKQLPDGTIVIAPAAVAKTITQAKVVANGETTSWKKWKITAVPMYNQRHGLRPGITGWGQIHYDYAASRQETREKLEYDLFYVKNASFLLDLAILLRTTRTLVAARGR